MQQSYFQIIEACERALADFDKTQELLEYPEVQADKAYYLSVLNRYSELQKLNAMLTRLKSALSETELLTQEMPRLSEEERTLALEELAQLRRSALSLADGIAEQLGCQNVTERVFCRMLAGCGAEAFCERLFELAKQDLLAHGVTVQEVDFRRKNGQLDEVSFVATGRNALARLHAIRGIHRVLGEPLQVAVAVTPTASEVTLYEKDVKIDLFHSSGAGGQNVNKVETAVRATHIPTGTVVVCQDERSQLKNKRRAMENLYKRLTEQNAELEKRRMDADVKAQLKYVSTLSFAPNGDFVDKVYGIQCLPTREHFSNYINTLLASQSK